MGDFDRVEKSNQAGESKKLIMVVTLGATLLGTVGYQLVKRGPQQASASEIPEGPAVSVSETPAVLRSTLLQNPTTGLLQGSEKPPAAKPMRNPFKMADSWLALLHQIKPDKPPVLPDPPKTQPKPVPEVVALGLRAEDYKLSSIVNSVTGMSAIINGRVVNEGGTVGKARVLRISGEEVLLQHIDFPNGPTTTLSMQPKINQ